MAVLLEAALVRICTQFAVVALDLDQTTKTGLRDLHPDGPGPTGERPLSPTMQDLRGRRRDAPSDRSIQTTRSREQFNKPEAALRCTLNKIEDATDMAEPLALAPQWQQLEIWTGAHLAFDDRG